MYGSYGSALSKGLSCNLTCTGKANQICGGVNASSIYLTSFLGEFIVIFNININYYIFKKLF